MLLITPSVGYQENKKVNHGSSKTNKLSVCVCVGGGGGGGGGGYNYLRDFRYFNCKTTIKDSVKKIDNSLLFVLCA